MTLPKFWTDRQGRKKLIKTMDTGYIQNCINMLKRNGFTKVKDLLLSKRHKTLAFYLDCPPPNGEMAQLCFDNEVDYWIENVDDLSDYNQSYINRKLPVLKALENELKAREEKWGS